MFFKKKAAGKAEPKLEDLKVDEQHTKSYHLGGDEIADDMPPPELEPGQDKDKALATEGEVSAEEISQTDYEAAEAEAEASDAIETMGAATPESSVRKPDFTVKKPSFPARKQAELIEEDENAQARPEEAELPSPPPLPVVDQKKADQKMKEIQAPKSQALQDMQEAGLTVEEDAAESSPEKEEPGKKDKGKSQRKGVENLATVARFRWYVLLFLAEISVLGWAVEAQFSSRPYLWTAWAVFAGTFLLGLLTFKVLRVPTRAGLAAVGWGVSYLVSAAYGPQDMLYYNVPAALIWSGLLTLIMLWVGVAIWRKIGRYKIIDIVLSVVLIYAALSPIWSLVDNIMIGAALNLRFNVLAASPHFLTDHLPWYLWPMTVTLIFVLPLAALFSLWDQLSALRRRGARHGGNIFLALAFISLIPYGFLSFDVAVKEQPNWASELRAVFPFPEAAAHAREAGVAATTSAAESYQPLVTAPESRSLPAGAETPAEVSTPPQPPVQERAVIEPAPLETPPAIVPEELKTEIEAAETLEKSAAPGASASPEQPSRNQTADVESSPEFPTAVEATTPDYGLEERLKGTEDRLNQALDRIDELEKQIREMKTEMKPEGGQVVPDDNSPTAFDQEAEGELSSSVAPRTSSGGAFISPGGLPEGLTMV